jgi:hypothetical protein
MELNYTIVYSKRKTLNITVERDRSVIVKAPEGTDPQKIRQAVESKRLWIYEKIRHPQKYRGIPHPPGKELVSGESMLYLGRNYRIDLVEGDHEGVRFANKFIMSKTTLSCARQWFRDWYIAKAKEKITPKVRYHAKNMGVEFNKVLISDLKYRWGSCTPKDNLNFNWRLIKAPMFVIDYVIVHELTHLMESNHTAQFWNIIEAQLPGSRKAKDWLKEYGAILEESF